MNNPDVLDADYEVISMVNKCHKYGPGPGGELPTFEIPAADTVPEVVSVEPPPALSPEESAALDERIQNVRNALPLILFGAFALFVFIAFTAL